VPAASERARQRLLYKILNERKEIEKVFQSSDESDQQDAIDFKENMRLWLEITGRPLHGAAERVAVPPLQSLGGRVKELAKDFKMNLHLCYTAARGHAHTVKVADVTRRCRSSRAAGVGAANRGRWQWRAGGRVRTRKIGESLSLLRSPTHRSSALTLEGAYN